MPERKNGTEPSAVEPVIVCPNCKKEIRLTESLAAPLVEATRWQYEQKLADKDSEIARREVEIRKQEKAVDDARKTVDNQIAEGIRKEREKIAAEEARKARLLVSDELQGRSKEVADLKEILTAKDNKLAFGDRTVLSRLLPGEDVPTVKGMVHSRCSRGMFPSIPLGYPIRVQ